MIILQLFQLLSKLKKPLEKNAVIRIKSSIYSGLCKGLDCKVKTGLLSSNPPFLAKLPSGYLRVGSTVKHWLISWIWSSFNTLEFCMTLAWSQYTKKIYILLAMKNFFASCKDWGFSINILVNGRGCIH